MAILRSINHPGVEIRELDVSQIAPSMVGTYFLIPGFTDKGEEFEPFTIGSMTDYEQFYGKPTNEAERYHYYTTREVIKNNGTAVCAKLPYDNIISNNYKCFGLNIADATTIDVSAPTDVQSVSSIEYGYTDYATVELTPKKNILVDDYDLIKIGGWAPSVTDDFIIVNEIKAPLGGPDEREGTFVVVVDPIDAMKVQRMLPNPQDSDAMDVLMGVTNIPTSGDVYTRALTGTFAGDSVSEDIMKKFPTIDYLQDGDKVNPEFSEYIGLIVCQTFYDSNGDERITVGINEAFVGSIFKDKINKATGISEYICDIVNAGSQYIKMYQNPNSIIPEEKETTVLYHENQEYELLAFTEAESIKNINGGTITSELKKVFDKVKNLNDIQIDVVVDGGLSTIAQFTDEISPYDPVHDIDPNDRVINSSTDLATWRNVVSFLEQFCSKIRKDCMAIVDVPRHLVIEGSEKYIRNTKPNNTFSNVIGPKLRYVTGINSSYAALYGNWFAMIDDFTGKPFWIPETVKVAGVYAYNDYIGNIWDAPAGLNRGVVNGVFDLSYNPIDTDMDQLYSKSINYAVKYILDGFIVEGQKTTQTKPSAFDRVNVRRLFLRLERATRQVCRYFVYEPNNLFVRRRLLDVLNPIFQAVKSAGGLYDYEIICDERNNTPQVIDNNELKVAILLKPVRTAEFILVDFIATKTDANFEEIIENYT